MNPVAIPIPSERTKITICDLEAASGQAAEYSNCFLFRFIPLPYIPLLIPPWIPVQLVGGQPLPYPHEMPCCVQGVQIASPYQLCLTGVIVSRQDDPRSSECLRPCCHQGVSDS